MKKISIVRLVIGKPPHTPESLRLLADSGLLDLMSMPGVENSGILFHDMIVDNGPRVFLGVSNVEMLTFKLEMSARIDTFGMGPDSAFIIVVLPDAIALKDDADLSTAETFTRALRDITPQEHLPDFDEKVLGIIDNHAPSHDSDDSDYN